MMVEIKDGDTVYFTSVYDPENHWIHTIWRGDPSDEQIKAAVEALVDMIKKTRARSWINDLQDRPDDSILHAVFSEEQRERIYNDSYFHGMKNHAQVSKGLISFLSVQNRKGERKKWFRYKNFSTLEEAKAWLKSLPQED